MRIIPIGKLHGHQDGAVYNGYIFHFNNTGKCFVYDINNLSDNSERVCEFILDKSELIVPHCNSVSFGNEKYCGSDEFPLLYGNIYNNYAKSENQLKGVTCVYRIERNGNEFKSTLVQLIEIGFCEDELWKSENDARPYGNFVIDNQNGEYIAFTMRTGDKRTRYFGFDLPKLNDGQMDLKYGVNRVVLNKEDIKYSFDADYQNFMQGATLKDGIVYTLEGFNADYPSAPPALRLVDIKAQKDIAYYNFTDYGLKIETELIDFVGETCYYADDSGNLFILEFQ